MERASSCIGNLRDESPNSEIFYSLKEAQIVIEQWRKYYNTSDPIHRWDIGHQRHRRSGRSRYL